MDNMRRALVGVILLLTVSAKAQQAPAQQPAASQQPPAEQVSVITFMGDVTTASVAVLIQLVNAQVRAGVHKITLVLSSGGGDSTAAFAAYNYIRHLPVELTTFNVGNVDSAAVILYCAGSHRYSFPATRFLIHGNSLAFTANLSMDARALQGNLDILRSLNQMLVQVVVSTTNKPQSEVENAVQQQVILTPDEAKNWGLVDAVKSDFMQPGAVLVSVSTPPQSGPSAPIQFISISPANDK